jgi:CBS domain containing-hemolysin-like protein
VRSRILPLAPGVYRVDGTAGVEEFNERFGPLLPAGQYETVAGLFLDHAGRIPQEGDSLDLPGVRLEVLERTERRILALKAEIRSSPAAPAASAPPRPDGPVRRA